MRSRLSWARLVQRLATELNALDAEHVFPVRLIANDFGKHALGLVPAPEELDYLLDSLLTTPHTTIAH